MAQQSAFQKSVILYGESSTENRRRHWKHIVGKQTRQKETDRMTLSRFFLSSERDTRPPRALSPETCWYGREVKRQLNVSTSLDRLNGTALQRGGRGTRNALSLPPVHGTGQNYIGLCTSCSLFHLPCTFGIHQTQSQRLCLHQGLLETVEQDIVIREK